MAGGDGRSSRELEADVAVAVEDLPSVEGVYALFLTQESLAHPDALSFAIVLVPYGIQELVQTHYAVLTATASYAVTGRVLYVNGATHEPVPMRRARKLSPGGLEREEARSRVAARKAEAQKQAKEHRVARLADLEAAFRRIAEQAARDAPPAPLDPNRPYRDQAAYAARAPKEFEERVGRALRVAAIATTLGGEILEIVPDPFPSPSPSVDPTKGTPPSPRKRVLVADDDLETDIAVRAMKDHDVVVARDGWTAVDHLTKETFDLVICAAVLGCFSGAKIYRMVVNERPEMRTRFVFLADRSALPDAPRESARGKVLARPLNAADVQKLLIG